MTDSIIQSLKQLLQKSPDVVGRMTWDAWQTETGERAEQVELARQYADGEHRAKLTAEMKELLRLDGSSALEDVSPFNLNHMDNIIQTLIDRLEVTAIETDTPAGDVWAKDVQDLNDFDALQVDVSESTVRDGDSFVMVAADRVTGRATFTHEFAYDGIEGVIPIYNGGTREMAAAIKIWRENINENNVLSEQSRVNVYYPGRIEKYVTRGAGGQLEQYRDAPGDTWPYAWVDRTGRPLPVPITPFKNRSKEYSNSGKTELADVISTQDALNRVLVSMVMATELTGFQIRTSIGFRPPRAISPGMWIAAVPKDTNGNDATSIDEGRQRWLSSIKIGTLEVGPLAPFLDEASFLIDQMYEITRTPRSVGRDSNASGEAQKQREIGLIGKARRCQISFGLSWQKVFRLAHLIESVFAPDAPPAVARIKARWRSPEIRDDGKTVENAVKVAPLVDDKTTLESIATVFGWDADKILEILAAKRKATGERLNALGASLPGFGGAGFDTTPEPEPDALPEPEPEAAG